MVVTAARGGAASIPLGTCTHVVPAAATGGGSESESGRGPREKGAGESVANTLCQAAAVIDTQTAAPHYSTHNNQITRGYSDETSAFF